nr:MAG TPA: hypothetical protein [Caudoviricetes sp.]
MITGLLHFAHLINKTSKTMHSCGIKALLSARLRFL